MTALSYAAEQVERYDHDRFMTAIFAPSAGREFLFALYAFNIEIAKTAEIVSESLLGRIRLQWWRDTLGRLYDGETVAHGVAEPLRRAIMACGLDRALFERLIDAREADLDKTPPPDMETLERYAQDTGAPLLALALQALSGGRDLTPEAVEAARLVGTAWALTGLVRAVPFHARQHRLYLPEDRLREAGIQIHRLFDLKPDPGVQSVVREIAHAAGQKLDDARRLVRQIPRGARSPLLLAELARLYLVDLRRVNWNPFALAARPHPSMRFAALTARAVLKGY